MFHVHCTYPCPLEPPSVLTDHGFDQHVTRFTERMMQDAAVDPAVRALLDELLAEDGTRGHGNPSQLVLRVRAVAVDASRWRR